MKRTLTLTLADEELLELQRIVLDDDNAEALRFLNRHLKDKVHAVLEGEGHCKPYFEVQARNNLLEGLQPRLEVQMLLDGFKIVQVLPCLADPAKIRVIASLSNTIDEVFPYLNATMKNIGYVFEAKTIAMKKEDRLITIYPHRVAIAKADDESDAEDTMRWLQDLVNQTWEDRSTITPSYQSHQVLRPLDVYGLLPKKNCKLCGEMTCLAFAVALLDGTRSLRDCHLLDDEEWSSSRLRLAEVLNVEGIFKG